MTAETLTGTRALANIPIPGPGWGTQKITAWGDYSIAANVEDGDIFELFKTPKNFLCLGGRLIADDIDTDATETLDMDVGYAANGGAAETYTAPWGTVYTNVGAASAAGILNAGVWVGDVVANLTTLAGIWRPFVFSTPLFFSRETMIQLEANAVAATFAAGVARVELEGIII